ncbi:efflux RND transporter periplasmic adaptor subunit [Aliiroseovarius sp. PTFE2010]|uniref:efflux RND transporter periplasmic adaptor subunit n=1 Tax=Aliiroseovarius sp. PTFE2010 TaxID=3417190 RepID=UPI003CF3FEFA
MRIFPIFTAVLVVFILYVGIFQRDALLKFAQNPSAGLAGLTDSDAQQAGPVADDGANGAANADAPETDATETDATETGKAEPARVVPVVAMMSKARTIDSGVVLRGRTEAARQVEVRAQTTSSVVSEPLRKGAYVEAGQVLCKLDPGTREASRAQAQAALTSAQTELEQAEKLAKDGYASQTRLINARAGLEQAQASLRAAENEIDNLTLTAPFPGLLETDTAEIGSFLAAGALCATVIQLDPIKIVGFVAEADVDRIEVGALAGAELINGDQVSGRVTFLSRSADPATRTFRVEIEVPNPDMVIRDGQTADIAVRAAGRTAHLLPQSALTLDDDGTLGVRTLNADDTAKFVPVSVLRDTREGIWVAGLPDEVSIITVGQEYVIDGVQTLPTYRETTQ